MSDLVRYTKPVLAWMTVLHLGVAVRSTLDELSTMNGLTQAGGSPIWADFINLYVAAQMVIGGQASELYLPDMFMAFERTLVPTDIWLRLWAYPPHSLLVVWPFGHLDYWSAFYAWSALGLAVLVWGARRAGFNWLETFILALSPAAVASIYYGQTGNVIAGLLLLALAAPRGGVVAAALLTIKPQAGFLLPVLWLIERKFAAIFVTGALALGLAALSLWLFGPDAWSTYVGSSLRELSRLEREGSGPFLLMIPSVFIAMRNLGAEATLAGLAHGAVAAAAAAFAIRALLKADGERARWAIMIAAMAAITPYIHIYDLVPVLAAAMLAFNARSDAPARARGAAAFVLVAVWALPILTMYGNRLGLPLGPIILLSLLAMTAIRSPRPSSIGNIAITEKSVS